MDTNTIINNNIISKNNSSNSNNNSNNNNNNNSTDDDDTIAADASIVAKLEYVASYSKVSLHESLSALYQWSLIEVTPSIPQHINNNNSSSSSSSSRGGDDKMLIFFQSRAIDIIFTTIINDDTLPLTANSVIREVFKSLLVNVLSFEHSPTQKPVGLIVNRFVFTYVV